MLKRITQWLKRDTSPPVVGLRGKGGCVIYSRYATNAIYPDAILKKYQNPKNVKSNGNVS